MPGETLTIAVPHRPWAAEARAMLALAWPLVLTNLSQFALAITDAVFLGRLGTEALAAGTLGANLIWAALAPAFGLALAAAPMCAQTRGRGRGFLRGVRRDLRAAFWACSAAMVPIGLTLWQAEAVLRALGQEPALAALAGDYVRAFMWGLLPFCWFVVLRGWLAAENRALPPLVISLGAIALNIPLNAWLIHGGLGIPPLGVVGAGIASAVCNMASLAALLAYVMWDRRLRRFHVLGRLWRFDAARLREVAVIGLPIAGTMALEIGLFSASALAMGWLGALAVAAHAIALQVASATFMVPMGIGQAATARVGLFTGAGQPAAAARAGWVAIAMGAGFMAASAMVLIASPGPIVWLFLDAANPGAAETARLAATLLVLAGIFQLADGLQAVAAGALRGLKDTRVPMLLAGFGYWVLAFPLALLLGFPAGLGPAGIWVGLAAGLFIVAGLMAWRWVRLSATGGLIPRRMRG